MVSFCGGVSLDASYRNRDNISYIDALGKFVALTARLSPGGVLVFVSSYAQMDKLFGRWNENGMIVELESDSVAIFREPRSSTAMNQVLKRYSTYKHIDACSQTISYHDPVISVRCRSFKFLRAP